MNKTQSKEWFMIAAPNGSVKPLSESMTSAFKLSTSKSDFHNFHKHGSMEGGRVLFIAPDLSNFGSFQCKTLLHLPT